MAVEQKVVIQVTIDPDMSKTAAVNAFLTQLDRRTKKSSTALKTLDAGFKKMGVTVGKAAAKLMDFGKKLMKMNLKVFAIEIAAVTASLLLMKAALATGAGFMRAWNNTVKFARAATAGFAASVLTLGSAIASAHRQFQQFQLAPFVGGLQNARTAMSGAMTAMPGYGQMAGQVGAVLNKAGIKAANVQAVMTQIGDMGAGDAKTVQSLAQAVATVKKSGSSAAGVTALQQMGPQFAASAQKAGAMGGQEFLTALKSGALTPEAFQGSMEMLNQTLFGGMKEMITRLYVRLASMGEIFLKPLREAMGEIEQIVMTGLFRVSGAIRSFGLDTFIPGFVSLLSRFTDWMVILINRDLPKLMGMFGSIASWWRSFSDGTKNFFGWMSAGLRSYSDAATVAWDMTKNLFGAVGGGMSDRFGMWREGFENNAGKMQQFGTNVGDTITAGMAVVGKLGTMFFDNLDTINSFLRFLADKVFPAIESFGGVFLGAFLAALPVIEVIVGMLLPVIAGLGAVIGMASGVPGVGGVAAIGTGMLATKRGRKALGVGAGRTMATGGIAKLGNKAGMGLLSTGLRAAPGMSSMGGAMALGAGVLGAGVGGAYMMNRATQSETATGGTLQGAAGGAMLGGAIGSVIPIPGVGTAVGAIVGGIIGGAVGWWKGKQNQKKLKAQGAELGKQMVDNLIDGFSSMTPEEMRIKKTELEALAENESALDKLAKDRNVSQETLTASLNANLSRLTAAIKAAENVFGSNETREANAWGSDYQTTGTVSSYMEGLMATARGETQTAQIAANFEAGANSKSALESFFQFAEDGGDVRSGPGAKLLQAATTELEQEGINRGHRGTNLGRFMRDAGSGMSGAATAGGWDIPPEAMAVLSGDLQHIGGAPDREFATSPLWNSIRDMGKMAGMKDMEKMLETAYNASDPDAAIAMISAQVYSDAAVQIVALKDAGALAAAELEYLAELLGSGGLPTAEDVENARKTREQELIVTAGEARRGVTNSGMGSRPTTTSRPPGT
jgi:hypothetical protein